MKKVVEFYNKLEAHLLVLSLAFTTVLIFVQVICRYVFSNSLSWSEELARYIFIWQIWLGTSVSMKENEHITLDMLENKFQGKAKNCLHIFANLVMILFCIFLTKYGYDLIVSMIARGNRSVALQIPMWIVYMSLPFSQLAVCLRVFGKTVREFVQLFGKGKAKEEQE